MPSAVLTLNLLPLRCIRPGLSEGDSYDSCNFCARLPLEDRWLTAIVLVQLVVSRVYVGFAGCPATVCANPLSSTRIPDNLRVFHNYPREPRPVSGVHTIRNDID